MMFPELRTRPIPFIDPLRSAAPLRAAATVVDAPVRALGTVRCSAAVAPPARLMRTASARYDGAHALNVRSCTTGQVYRFTHPGAVVTIDAADISLMKRIEQVTVLV